MDLVRFCLMVTLMIPSVIESYVMISVACCGWPIYFRVVLSASNYLALYNNSPHSASADDVITLLMMVDMTIIAPFGRLISSPPPLCRKISCSSPWMLFQQIKYINVKFEYHTTRLVPQGSIRIYSVLVK